MLGPLLFLVWLSSRAATNCPRDSDNLKHIVNPHQVEIAADKCIFIVGDPIDALISLYNRKYIRTQMKKLTGKDFNISIDEYAESGLDLIGYTDQLENWLSYSDKEVMFLTYPFFWDFEKEINEYVGLSLDESLFEKKERTSGKQQLQHGTLVKLENIYAPLYEEMDNMGKFLLKPLG